MTDILNPGQSILFMKVGVHAKETLEEIIARKSKEIDEAGYALWGYGGNTCHPTTKVQPFAQQSIKQGIPIYLCMESMDSKHFAEPVRAEYYSVNGIDYKRIPDSINVLGSRFALAIRNLHEEKFALPLSRTRVSIGDCKGRSGGNYVQGRVDKACLTLSDDILVPPDPEEKVVGISLVAELCEPYAVFLKN